MNYMRFHHSCTRNCDHHILLINTGNAHKERTLSQVIIHTFEDGGIETLSKMIVAAKWWLLSQLQK